MIRRRSTETQDEILEALLNCGNGVSNALDLIVGIEEYEHDNSVKASFRDGKRKPKRIIFNDPATIVFWDDGTKTVVKCMEGRKFSKYYGFLAALAKKYFGSNSQVCRVIEEASGEKIESEE